MYLCFKRWEINFFKFYKINIFKFKKIDYITYINKLQYNKHTNESSITLNRKISTI